MSAAGPPGEAGEMRLGDGWAGPLALVTPFFLRQRADEQNRPHIISPNKGDGLRSGTVTLEKARPSSTD